MQYDTIPGPGTILVQYNTIPYTTQSTSVVSAKQYSVQYNYNTIQVHTTRFRQLESVPYTLALLYLTFDLTHNHYVCGAGHAFFTSEENVRSTHST